MQDRILYEYAIIRVLPKVERGEFINIGVIMMSKKFDFLAIRYHIDKTKLKILSPDLELDMIKEYLESWEKVCKGGDDAGNIGQLELHLRFRWLTANRSTMIQSSPVHPGLCFDLEPELDLLFKKFVL